MTFKSHEILTVLMTQFNYTELNIRSTGIESGEICHASDQPK
jgi:hypothetical protein